MPFVGPGAQPFGQKLLTTTILLSFLLVFGERPAWAEEQKGVIWVDMTEASPTYTAGEFKEALGLRLPGWTVKERPPGAKDDFCEDKGPNHYIARIETTVQGKTSVELVSCQDAAILIKEQIDQQSPKTEDALRRAAVLTAMTLDLDRDSGRTAAELPEQDHPETGPPERTRPHLTVGVGPGLSLATQNPDLAVSGLGDVGLLFTNNLWLQGGFKLSSSYEGTSEKEDTVGVTDFGFWLGLAYLIELNRRWFCELGVAGQYTHVALEDLTSGKREVEEDSAAARFGLRATAGAGVRFFPVFGVFLRVSPVVSFGERSYAIRGSTAVHLGYAIIDFSLGAVFFF